MLTPPPCSGRTMVTGVTELGVATAAEVHGALAHARRRRATGPTGANAARGGMGILRDGVWGAPPEPFR